MDKAERLFYQEPSYVKKINGLTDPIIDTLPPDAQKAIFKLSREKHSVKEIYVRSYNLEVGGKAKGAISHFLIKSTHEGAEYISPTLIAGVKPGVNVHQSNFQLLEDIMDNLQIKALTSPSPHKKARAIAEFQWIQSTTAPTIRGGGDIMNEVDIKLLEAAGFTSPSRYNRVELDALTSSKDAFVDRISAELMTRWVGN